MKPPSRKQLSRLLAPAGDGEALSDRGGPGAWRSPGRTTASAGVDGNRVGDAGRRTHGDLADVAGRCVVSGLMSLPVGAGSECACSLLGDPSLYRGYAKAPPAARRLVRRRQNDVMEEEPHAIRQREAH